jgi:hypothetical protein
MSKQSDLVNITQGDADINGGTIDGTVIGGSTPAAVTGTAGSFSNLSVNGNPIATAGSLSNRNKIINGAMVIDQRNAGSPVTVDNTASYTVDRWLVEDGSDAVLSAQRSTDVPSNARFANSLKVTATTADASIGAAQFAVITQIIEGFNAADFGFGTSNATSVTVSFWVKATVPGQYSCTVYNSGASRINPQAFTIASSNTWEYKTITFEGDTTGTWLTNNGRGIVLNFYIALGSNFLGSAGWNGSSIYGVTGQANALASINDIFAITGVQLEAGDTATPFEHRSYGQELALCQRYYEIFLGQIDSAFNPSVVSTNYGTWFFKTEKRTTPTITQQGLNITATNAVNRTAAQWYGPSASLLRISSATASAEL